jgi:hypothetical protein
LANNWEWIRHEQAIVLEVSGLGTLNSGWLLSTVLEVSEWRM